MKKVVLTSELVLQIVSSMVKDVHGKVKFTSGQKIRLYGSELTVVEYNSRGHLIVRGVRGGRYHINKKQISDIIILKF